MWLSAELVITEVKLCLLTGNISRERGACVGSHCGAGKELQVSRQSSLGFLRPYCFSKLSLPPPPAHRPSLPRFPTSWEDGQALEGWVFTGGRSCLSGVEVGKGRAAGPRRRPPVEVRPAVSPASGGRYSTGAHSKNWIFWLSLQELQTLTALSSPVRRLFPLVSFPSSHPMLPPPPASPLWKI